MTVGYIIYGSAWALQQVRRTKSKFPFIILKNKMADLCSRFNFCKNTATDFSVTWLI